MVLKIREARRAMRALAENPDDTAQAFRVIAAMSGGSANRLYRRFRRSAGGSRILREKHELHDVLADIDRLGAMPDGSLGRAIHEFYTTEQISAQGLAAASESIFGDAASAEAVPEEIDEDRARFGRRLRDLHDVFHVLSGYGRDMRGEIAVLAFTYSQTKNRGIAYLVLRVLRGAGWRSEMGRLIRQGYHRGRRSAWLIDLDWEALLPRPLDHLREELGVGPAPAYEPLRSPGAPVLAA